jgi:hypothetical protein
MHREESHALAVDTTIEAITPVGGGGGVVIAGRIV